MITRTPPKTSTIVAAHFDDKSMTWALAFHNGAYWCEASDGQRIKATVVGWSEREDARAARRWRMVIAEMSCVERRAA